MPYRVKPKPYIYGLYVECIAVFEIGTTSHWKRILTKPFFTVHRKEVCSLGNSVGQTDRFVHVAPR